MVYGLWQSAAGLQAQEYRQSIIINNLANTETPGFKPERIAFQERLNAAAARGDLRAKVPALEAMTGGLFETPVYTDFTQAAAIPSNNAMDVAIDGDGFLTVKTKDGPRYTRDGRLDVSLDGTLIQATSGAPVVDAQGQKITIDRTSGVQVRIDESGQVRQGESIAGRIALVDFADRRQMSKVGQNLYAVEGGQGKTAGGRIKQFAYEASGAEPVSGLAEMIAASRVYEANAALIRLQDDSLARAVTDLGRVA